MPLVAVLDASVLFPMALCDLLLRLAERALYQPRWSDLILDETRRSLSKQLGIGADRRLAAMIHAFPDAMVPPSTMMIEETPILPDPNDRHVVAAAITGRAGFIVTHNLRHFPATALPVGISAEHPDRFLQRILAIAPAQVVSCINAQAADTGRHGKPALSIEHVLHSLEQVGTAEFAAAVRSRSPELR